METDHETRVRDRAYYLWEKEGSPDGRDKEFWERARLMETTGGPSAVQAWPRATTAGQSEVDEAMKETFPASDPPAFTASKRVAES